MSIDASTGKIIQHRQQEKIQYQTSFTDFPVFVTYCKCIKQANGIKKKSINGVLGIARRKINPSWKQDYDSHACISLQQYNLIKLVDDKYVLDDLGEKLVSLFDNGDIPYSREEYLELTYKMIVSWHQNGNGYNIHPGLILLKLMLEPDLKGFITSQDIAHIFNNKETKNDSQYASFVDQIVSFRNSGKHYSKDELKKTYTLLTGYVKWNIFSLVEEASNSIIKTVVMQPDFLEYCKKQLCVAVDTVLTDEEFSSLVSDAEQLKSEIDSYTAKYGSGRITVTYETRVSQIQTAFRNRLISLFGHKCMMCNITNSEMLVGSHIKRDSVCDTIAEKIDHNNGFLLCANHDKLFDRYLISFDAFTGNIMISSSLTEDELKICELNKDYKLPQEYLTPERVSYLIWHNEEFIKKENGEK